VGALITKWGHHVLLTTLNDFQLLFTVFNSLQIIITEIIHSRQGNRCGHSTEPIKLGGCNVPAVMLHCYNLIVCFLFGAGAEQTVINILKYSVGRLRPHFFDMCQPDMLGVTCTDKHGLPLYVTAYTCLGTNTGRLKDMRLSFPSGHASLSSYSMIFAVIYLQARLTWHGSRLLRPLLQTGLVWVAIGVSVSRISDYKHHWGDVLAGFLVGLIIAILTGLYAAKLCGKQWKRVHLKLDEIIDRLEQHDNSRAEQRYV